MQPLSLTPLTHPGFSGSIGLPPFCSHQIPRRWGRTDAKASLPLVLAAALSYGTVSRRRRPSALLLRAAPVERFSPAVKESLDVAFQVAHSMGHLCSGVGTDHLLVGMATVSEASASRALRSVGVTAEGLNEKLTTFRESNPPERLTPTEALSPPLDSEVQFYLRRASGMLRWLPAQDGVRMLGTEHIMLGLLSNGSHAAGKLLLALDKDGFDRTVGKYDSGSGGSASNPRRAALRKAIMQIVNDGEGDADPRSRETTTGSTTSVGSAGRGQSKPLGEDASLLDRFAPDLTSLAAEGFLDPYMGRESLIDRIERVLGRRQKPNVLLVGDPGVGKTALVEAIAQRIVEGKVPPWLRQKRLRTLDVARLTAGTRLRGDFEERLSEVLAEVDAEKSILFIDEAHTVIGAGATGSSSLDASDMLKPALARGALRCIAATTVEEYAKYFARDAALERRFEVVEVEEPSPDETLQVLEGLRGQYERHHGVTFAAGSLEAAAAWAARHLPERRLPDKAIDVADRAAVLAKTRSQSSSQAATPVTTADVATAIEETVGLRPGSVSAAEARGIVDLEAELRKHVRGQRDAVHMVATAVARAKAGLQEEHRPIASLLLYGPPGVGKTSLATALAETWLGSRRALVRVDCASASSVEQAGSALAAAVRRRPHSVVLIDEADKAESDFLGLLLEVIEEASLSLTGPGAGRVDFRHTVVLLTSNDPAGPDALPRALADRLDGSEPLRPLSATVVEEVLDGLVEDFASRLIQSHSHAELHVTDEWRKTVLDKIGFGDHDAGLGARVLRRALRRFLEDPIAFSILDHQVAPGGPVEKVLVDVDSKGQVIISMEKK